MDILRQFDGKINGTLETFDRIIINGYIQPLHSEGHPDRTGLICAFSVVEPCKTMTVKPNRDTKKLEVVSRTTKCKHYYFYYNDEEFGWMFLKIQTWFPYNVQIYLNGREYLSRLLRKENIPFAMYNNSFSYIEDFSRAQELADSVLNKKLSASFDGKAQTVNCLLPDIMETLHYSYDWCVGQCELATDINFKSREELSRFYKTLVETTQEPILPNLPGQGYHECITAVS